MVELIVAATLYIAGLKQPTLLKTWNVMATANGRDALVCDVPSEDASYRPELDDEVLLLEGFGTSTTTLNLATGAQSVTTQAGLPMVAGDRIRLYSATNPDKWLDTPVVSYSGTTLGINADNFNGTGSQSSWVVARRIFGGNVTTPIESGINGLPITPINTRIEASDFNSLIDRRYITASIPAGTLKAALLVVEPYLTTYGVSLDPAQVDGPSLPALEYGQVRAADVMTELATLSGYLWEIDYDKILRMRQPGSTSAPFTITAGDGNTVGDVTVAPTRRGAGTVYANRVIVVAGTPEVPIIAEANDVPEQTAHGLWEISISAPEVFDLAVAQALADAYLIQRTPTPKIVTYASLRKGLKPGQTQTINLPRRNVNNVFILTDVNRASYGQQDTISRVTALEGAIYQPGWRNLYRQWLQPLTTVTVVPGTAGAGRQAFFFGGSSIEYVDSGTPFDWVPLDGTVADPGMQVALDTVSRGSTSLLVTARMRASSGTVQCRLRNISDGVTVGTSAVVNSSTWQTVTFTATLTNGSKIYRAELLGSQNGVDIAGIVYAE